MKSYTLVGIMLLSMSTYAAELVDIRYCGTPKRDADGKISRSITAINDFKHIHPCPVDNKTGACPGWAIDHVIPLACGGCDAVYNMQWLPTRYKITGKDRWERKIYALSDSSSCKQELVPTK